MFNYPARVLFCGSLILGTLISISANTWFGAWVGLELNLLSFIPLLSGKNMMASEAALKYFLTQAMASIFLFFAVLFFLSYFKFILTSPNQEITIFLLFITALLIKLGAAPFHFWFPGVMEGSSWMNGLILMTWQKIAPVILMSYVFYGSLVTYLIIILSVLVGAIGGLNQTSLRKIMAYSSINHLGWILSGLLLSNLYWFTYFLFYCFLSFSLIFLFHQLQLSRFHQLFLINDTNNFNKIFLFCNFLSLGGLPPFVGFLPKWLIIQGLTLQGLAGLAVVCTTLTLIVLFYYLRIFFPAILLSSSHPKWMNQVSFWSSLNTTLGSISLLGLPLFPLIYTLM
uniref:NADH-ubiquinone oxidoreductase chain 2 n=1 Tax=Serratella zapekinae TaxID=2748051 RepID=A0A7D6JXR9_9INSE|nr:NADH dehydrogenase subunit 2 [Serratella zapekinae]QLP88995.1 NADH dehydrogenase subunit 2 [Serratella zapekinae]